MLVAHRTSKPLKLADHVPAPAYRIYRIWAVRSVVALLVALLVFSNAVHAAGAGGRTGKINRTERKLDSRATNERWNHQPGKDRVEGNSIAPSPWKYHDYYKENPLQRLRDGRYAAPPLNQSKSKEPASYCYRQTEKVLQRHPIELLKRGADGRFMDVSMFATTPLEKEIFSQLHKLYATAATDLLASVSYKKINTLQSSVSLTTQSARLPTWHVSQVENALNALGLPTQSASSKLKLFYNSTELKNSLLGLPIGEKSVENLSVAKKAGIKGPNLPEVSSIEVQGNPPNTILDIMLVTQNNLVVPSEVFSIEAQGNPPNTILDIMLATQNNNLVGRVNLDKAIDTIAFLYRLWNF